MALCFESQRVLEFPGTLCNAVSLSRPFQKLRCREDRDAANSLHIQQITVAAHDDIRRPHYRAGDHAIIGRIAADERKLLWKCYRLAQCRNESYEGIALPSVNVTLLPGTSQYARRFLRQFRRAYRHVRVEDGAAASSSVRFARTLASSAIARNSAS